MEMTEEQARAILGDWVQEDNSLRSDSPIVLWQPDLQEVDMDGVFSSEQVEAIHWWTRYKFVGSSEDRTDQGQFGVGA